MSIVEKIQAYIASMAPHQKERMGGKLIIESLEHIQDIEKELNQLREFKSNLIQNTKELNDTE